MVFFTGLFKVSKPLTFFRLAKYSIWLSPNDLDAPRNHKLRSAAPSTRLGRDKPRKGAPGCLSALAGAGARGAGPLPGSWVASARGEDDGVPIARGGSPIRRLLPALEQVGAHF